MERTLIAAGLLLALLLAIQLVRFALSRSKRRLVAELRDAGAAPADSLRILYFTTPECVECRLRQEPALRQLEERFGPQLRVDKHDAIEEADLARKYRVRTVPTTAVFDATGRLVEINYGFASPERLAAQLTGGAAAPA